MRYDRDIISSLVRVSSIEDSPSEAGSEALVGSGVSVGTGGIPTLVLGLGADPIGKL